MGESFSNNLEIINEFIQESLGHLENVEKEIIYLNQNPFQMEKLIDIKRAFHTIKGVSAFLELSDIEYLTYTTEDTIEFVISNNIEPELDLIDFISDSSELTKECINSVEAKTRLGNIELKKVDREGLKQRADSLIKKYSLSLKKTN